MAELHYEILAPGLSWLEVPSVGLRILCGCPADSVKHLTHAGKIQLITEHGVTFETGPNAILLADDLLQNGLPANMAEFPVLQMFYKQGQILPNHPNNRGEQPILIGSAEQVHAQLHYIYRGNYGLTTPEELLACGVSLEDTMDMMAMKMQFAFGRIQTPEELLASCVVSGPNWRVLKGDLLVARLAPNQYRFQLGAEFQDVDLRLAEGETYPTPYVLPDQQLPRDEFAVWHTGEGDGWDGSRPCMASLLMLEGRPYLVDAGPNIHYTLEVLGIDLSEVAGIFHTHAHDDHFAGMPTLLQAGHRLKYYATPLVRRSIFQKLSALLSLPLPELEQFFELHDLQMDAWNPVTEQVHVQPRFSPHPVETNIFYFRHQHNGETRVFGHLADIVSSTVLGRMCNPAAKYHIRQEFHDRALLHYRQPCDVKKIDAGGGMIHGEVVDFVKDETQRLILAHSAMPFPAEQLQLASTAPFGSSDLRIPRNPDSLFRQSARAWLKEKIPTATNRDLDALLQEYWQELSRDHSLIEAQQPLSQLFLLLTGQVQQNGIRFPAGTLLGEAAGLAGEPERWDVQTHGPARVWPIPLSRYRDLLYQQGLLSARKELSQRRDQLRRVPALQFSLTDTTLERLLAQAHRVEFAPEQPVQLPAEHLGILLEGELQALNGERQLILEPGSAIGLACTLERPAEWDLQATVQSHLLCFSCAALRQIPGVRWYLHRTFQHRQRHLTG